MRTVSEVGKHAMCTYHVRGRKEKIVASTIITTSSMKRLGDRSSGYFPAFPAMYNSEMKSCELLVPQK